MTAHHKARTLSSVSGRHITVGAATVVWARSGDTQGWRLPGGGITTDYVTAAATAERMNLAMGAA